MKLSRAVLVACVTISGCTPTTSPPIFSAAPVPALDLPFGSRAEHFTVTSKENGRSYRVSVLLPPGYAQSDQESYPTFYVYDAVGERFGYMAELAAAAEIDRPGLIWVGVGPATEEIFDAQRYSDLTPTYRADQDEQVRAGNGGSARTDSLNSGGASALLRVFERELIPYIDGSYRTTGERALGGHSLGALFAAYVLVERTELFSAFLLASPSLWWDEEVLIRRVASARANIRPHSLRVFLTVGGEEDAEMKSGHANFDAALRSLDLPGLSLMAVEYPGAEHAGTVIPSMLEGLSYIFARVEPN